MTGVGAVDEAKVHGLIQGAYNAASEGNWKAFLGDFTRAVGADSAWLVRLDFGSMRSRVEHHAGCEDAFVDQFHRAFSDTSLYAEPLSRVPLGKVTNFNRLVAKSEAIRTSFFTDFVRPAGFHLDGNACVLQRGIDFVAGLAVHYRADRQEALIPSTHRFQELVTPHILAARQLEERIKSVRSDSRDLLMALESHDCAVMSCDSKGRVRVVSRAASSILAAEDGLSCRAGALTALDAGSRARLQLALARAANLSQREGSKAPEVVEVMRNNGRPPYEIVVSPVPERSDRLRADDCRILLFIDDPCERPETDEGLLQRRFALTQKEARIARLLAQGHSPVEVADLLVISRETVKSHTKAIYAKTGARRHADLCSRLLGGLRRISRPR